jgi:hypothetical protein
MITRATVFAVACGSLAFGCSTNDMTPAEEQAEIVDNLTQAGFPTNEVLVYEGKVYAGLDAIVSLAGSREMLQTDDARTDEQYRTTNLMSTSIAKVCVNPSSSFAGNSALMTGLNAAVSNYNNQGLTFKLAVGPTTGCGANISITTQSGTGSSSGFPSGGLPYPGPIYIGTGTPTYGSGPTKHVIEHEIGHAIGFRHSDYYNRAISCGTGGNEGSSTVGAILIPGTPSTATYNGSVYNACYNSGSTGTFTSSDVVALQYLY